MARRSATMGLAVGGLLVAGCPLAPLPLSGGSDPSQVTLALGSGGGAPATASALPTPTVTSYAPTVGAPGSEVRIYGTNLGMTQGSAFAVAFGNLAAAAPSRVSDSQILVQVPPGATNAPITLRTSLGNLTSPLITVGNFTVVTRLYMLPIAPVLEPQQYSTGLSTTFSVSGQDSAGHPVAVDPTALTWESQSYPSFLSQTSGVPQATYAPSTGTGNDQVTAQMGELAVESGVTWDSDGNGLESDLSFANPPAGAGQSAATQLGLQGRLASFDAGTSYEGYQVTPIFVNAGTPAFVGTLNGTWCLYGYPDDGGGPMPGLAPVRRWEGSFTLTSPNQTIPVAFPLYPKGTANATGDLYVRISINSSQTLTSSPLAVSLAQP